MGVIFSPPVLVHSTMLYKYDVLSMLGQGKCWGVQLWVLDWGQHPPPTGARNVFDSSPSARQMSPTSSVQRRSGMCSTAPPQGMTVLSQRPTVTPSQMVLWSSEPGPKHSESRLMRALTGLESVCAVLYGTTMLAFHLQDLLRSLAQWELSLNSSTYNNLLIMTLLGKIKMCR